MKRSLAERRRDVDSAQGEIAVGESLEVRARIALGELTPDEVEVQLFQCPVDTRGEIAEWG